MHKDNKYPSITFLDVDSMYMSGFDSMSVKSVNSLNGKLSCSESVSH